MITIREKAQGKRKYYERAVSVGDNEIVQLVEYRMTTVEKDSRVFFVLYDDEMNSISPFFRFINYSMEHLAYSSREQAAHACG